MGDKVQTAANRALPPGRARNWRWRGLLAQLAPLLVGVALLLLATALIAILGIGPGGPAGGATEHAVGDGQAAPDFRLTDQFGAPVSLAGLRGKVVLLTFLYSSCPDICPVTLGKFGMAREMLGVRGDDVAFLVVTVDPERDDPARLRRFLEGQGLDRQISFLTGDRAAVGQVWREYGITVTRGPAASAAGEGAYEVIHSDRIYLIDRAGCARGLLRSTATPQELVVSLAGPLTGPTTGEAGRCG